jgi:hypothetical protein
MGEGTVFESGGRRFDPVRARQSITYFKPALAPGLCHVLVMCSRREGFRANLHRVEYHGQVLWISGTQMMIRDDDGWTFPVDLRRVSQDSYRDLRNGDWVTVVGVVSRSRSHVIDHSVRVDS